MPNATRESVQELVASMTEEQRAQMDAQQQRAVHDMSHMSQNDINRLKRDLEAITSSKGKCAQRCDNCINSRSGSDWRKLIFAYTLFYLFLSAWMASLMTIYMQTRPALCQWQNGEDFCMGEARNAGLLKARISIDADEKGEVFHCDAEAPNCTGSTTLKFNDYWPLRELPADLTIACSIVTDETNKAPLAITCDEVPWFVEQQVTEKKGIISNRHCEFSGNNVTMYYYKGSLAPMVMQFNSTYENTKEETMTGKYSCQASSQNASVMDHFETGFYQSSQIDVVLNFGPDGTLGKPDEVAADIV